MKNIILFETRVMEAERSDVFKVHPDANLSLYAKNGTLTDYLACRY